MPRAAPRDRGSTRQTSRYLQGLQPQNRSYNILWGSKISQHHMGVKTQVRSLGMVSRKPRSPVFPPDARTTLRQVRFRPVTAAGNMCVRGENRREYHRGRARAGPTREEFRPACRTLPVTAGPEPRSY